MTKERGQDLLLVAVVLSVVFHAALMFFVRARPMTHINRSGLHERRRETLRISDYQPTEDPVRIERIRDIMSVKEAPPAEASEPLDPVTEQLPENAAQHWNGAVPAPEAPPSDAVAAPVEVFDVTPIDLVAAAEAHAPKIEYTPPLSRSLTAPVVAGDAAFSMPVAFGSLAPTLATPKFVAPPPERRIPAAKPVAKEEPSFVPAQEVYDAVDEKIVEKEKEAVRELMEVDDAAPLERFVNLAAARAEDAQWTYFKLLVSPRTSLAVVPKDIVIILDASGSIGAERLASCRSAAKGLLRSALNSGDRFNLVAFRNRFSYAFRRWQDCSQASFAAADKWLSNLAAHGRTDVFGTIRSVLALPRDPTRPLIALVVTDGDANAGVSDTAQILSKFTELNDGLVSVYMYGVKEGANRELIDVLTHGNRGESYIYGGLRWKAGAGIESLSTRFRDPVLTDLRVIFAAGSQAEVYPRLLRNLYLGDAVTLVGRVPKGRKEVSFSLKGLNGKNVYEAFFRVPLEGIAGDPSILKSWAEESQIDAKLR